MNPVVGERGHSRLRSLVRCRGVVLQDRPVVGLALGGELTHEAGLVLAVGKVGGESATVAAAGGGQEGGSVTKHIKNTDRQQHSPPLRSPQGRHDPRHRGLV